MIRNLFFVILFILTASSVAFPQNKDPFERVKLISDFVNHGLGLSLSTSDASIRALGKIKNVTVEQYEDRGIIMERRTYYLNGLQIVAHFGKGKNINGGIMEAVVTDSKWKIEKGLRVGTSIDTVMEHLSNILGSGLYCLTFV